MAIANNLNNLVYDIEKQYRESYKELKDFLYIPEVYSFLRRREKDLVTFKKLTSRCSSLSDVFSVKSYLEEAYPNYSKYYGGICLKGADYFKITKKVRKAIDEEKKELERQAVDEVKEDILNFDKNFCIPDELDSETMSKFYE